MSYFCTLKRAQWLLDSACYPGDVIDLIHLLYVFTISDKCCLYVANKTPEIIKSRNEWCFRSRFCTCMDILGLGQPGLLRWILSWIMPLVQDWSLGVFTSIPVRAATTAPRMPPDKVSKKKWKSIFNCTAHCSVWSDILDDIMTHKWHLQSVGHHILYRYITINYTSWRWMIASRPEIWLDGRSQTSVQSQRKRKSTMHV